MIRRRNIQPGTTLNTIVNPWHIPCQLQTTANYYLNASALTGIAVGATIAATSWYMRSVMSLALLPGGTFGASSATFTINGENQFGETVSEDLTFTGNVAQHTLYCYRRVTSIVLKAVTGTLTATLSVGHDGLTAGTKVPMPAKLVGVGSASNVAVPSGPIKGAAVANQITAGSQPTFTFYGAPYYTIAMGAITAVASLSAIIVHLDDDPNL